MDSRAHIAQQVLKDANLYKGKVDGKFGTKSQAALAKYPGINPTWSLERRIVACLQLACKALGINTGAIDGYWGPSTSTAVEEYLFVKENKTTPPIWRPEDLAPNVADVWPKAYTPAFDSFYGPKGESNLVKLAFPYQMKIAWNTSQKVTSTRCHKKVAESASRVFHEVMKHYGQQQITALKLDYFGGCFNDRSIRGGTKPSMHSWGIAFDFDPSRNQLKWGRDRATFARPEYDAWWRIWEAEGWVSLGRARNFDWMHVQAATI